MKKLFLLGLFLISYGVGIAQDTIVPNRNQNIQKQSTIIQNQQSNPVPPKAPEQPVAPAGSVAPNPTVPANAPNQTYYLNNQPAAPVPGTAPNQMSAPVQTNVPAQPPVVVQPSTPVQSQVQTNVPAQQNVPIQQNQYLYPQYRPNSNYTPMSEEARIGGRVVRFTFIASPQIAWMTSNSRLVSESKAKFGFAYGVEGDIFLASERYSLLTGMVVSSLGGTLNYKEAIKFSGLDLPANTKVEYYLRYLEIPFALKMRSKDFNNMRFFAQFGLNTWFNIKGKASTSDGSLNKDAAGDEVRFFNLGLNVGGGVEYDLGNRNSVTAGLIYTGSFNDATNNATVSDRTTINSLRIRLGFIF
jgi:hypothetical protein